MAEERDTRTRLLDAAIEVIEAHGETAVRIRDISATAGVSYASLYHFFTDREGLIEAAQVERITRHLFEFHAEFAHLVASCRTEADFHDALRAGIEFMFGDRRDVRWTRMNVWGTAQSRPALADRLAEVQTLHNTSLAGILVGPQRKGWIRGDIDLLMFSAWLMGCATGRLLVEVGSYDGDDLAAWDHIASDAVFAVLTGTTMPGDA